MNKIISILILIFLLLFLIVTLKQIKKIKTIENFDYGIKIIESGSDRVISEYNNFIRFEESIDPVDPNKNFETIRFSNDTSYKLSRKTEYVSNNFTLGFYFKELKRLTKNENLVSGKNKDGMDILNINLTNDNIHINYEGNQLSIPLDKNIDNDSGFSYIVLQGNLNNPDFIPKLSIIYNNKKFEIILNNREAQPVSLKDIIFGNGGRSTNGFEGLIGKILIFNEIISRNQLCEHYNCNLSCFVPDGTKTYDGDVNKCIADCNRNCGDITTCQDICVNCNVEGLFWDTEEKIRRCPWLKEIRVLDRSVPDAPKIRGFPGDGKILIEWKKPFDGRSKIKNYIVLYYETFKKTNGINVSISSESDQDVLEYEIKPLKNKTYYDIEVRAVNAEGIGSPSNIISIAPNGNIVSNNNRNIFGELDEDLQKEVDKKGFNFMCNVNNVDSVGHTLDFYDNKDLDIKKYIEELK